ncbi:aromatic amino acid aminotransferase [Heyndrickxia shackletonii]|uniref:Aminotransferase n=1 Tax=Heyndrickxia shackletonii TaxID=157838 RepID=A0A0Q3TLG8_9BACI|nr:aminotransferase A [Heyndrickxia shackletonii]KQL54824.1 aromatic amino acid aminotransferase [Heyndrickxia shackletonii]NEY99527.1 aminotransferase A [Heyndrickxia shackletonii]
MEHLLNKRVLDIEISGIRKFSNMVSGVENMISFTIGQPDFPTPTHVKNAGIAAIENDFTIYTHNAGYIELRKAASDFVKQKYNLQYDAEKEVIVTVGASEAIDVSLRTILTEGSEVILPGPIYPGYEPIIRIAGGIPVHVDTRDSHFKLTAEKIAPYLTDKTRCIILPYPSNPTGVSLTEKELKDIARLLKGRNIFVIADEIYSELVYENKHYSIANDLREQTIVINGLSKSHSMTGWRIGFLFAPENIAKHIIKVHQYNVSCVSSISQMAAIEALTKGYNDAEPMREEYIKRRDYVCERLTKMGLEYVKPDGAFYFFVKIPHELELSSFDFAVELAYKNKIAVVPGSAFSIYGEGFFRLSYACSMEKLEEGLNRMEKYLVNKS